MRIIAGEFRRRVLETPADDSTTRPIPDFVKESLFSILRGHCENAHVFDGFAGTGAIGLEALSRGAARCTFVEKEKKVGEILRRNIAMLKVEGRTDVMVGDALGAGALARAPRPLHLAFLDPPYPLVQDAVGYRRVMAQVANLVKLLDDTGYVVLRTPWPLRHAIPQEAGDPNSHSLRTAREGKERFKKGKGRSPTADWRREKRAYEGREDVRAAQTPRGTSRRGMIAGTPAGKDADGVVEWFEPDELEQLVLDAQDTVHDGTGEEELPSTSGAAAAAKPVWSAVDLTIPGVLGPETHAYRGMAVHLYMKERTPS